MKTKLQAKGVSRPQQTIFRLVLGFMLCCTSVLIAFNAQSAGIFAPTPCDMNGYYKSLESRAWLEAQREITQNQNLIFKPDSVLEYTCFDGHLSELADHAKDMFSETNRWGSFSGNMSAALTNLIGTALSAYETANFNHSFLGGRITTWAPIGAPVGPGVSGTGYAMSGSVSAGSYSCGVMNAVWMKAKCMDFVDNTTNDGFFTFQEYASSSDKRFLPTPCSGGVNWSGNIDIAYAKGGTPWVKDDMEIYYDLIYPTAGCGTPLETGLTVHNEKAGVATYEENFCIVPGCHYEPTAGGGSCK